jgi:hypothetical protein
MNCFVIMPFAPEFDDVYATIKHAIESSTATREFVSRGRILLSADERWRLVGRVHDFARDWACSRFALLPRTQEDSKSDQSRFECWKGVSQQIC